MNTKFQDNSKSPPRVFEVSDAVTFKQAGGVYRFYRDGVDLKWPDAFTPYVAPPPSLAAAKAKKSQEIDQACKAQILSGFKSSALGSEYHYPSKETDQQNLNSSVVASLLPSNPSDWTAPFWCAASSGVWALREHTTAQIQQVGIDAKDAVLSAIVKNGTLQLQIEAADTVENVDLIVW